jgi:hypothetical protein
MNEPTKTPGQIAWLVYKGFPNYICDSWPYLPKETHDIWETIAQAVLDADPARNNVIESVKRYDDQFSKDQRKINNQTVEIAKLRQCAEELAKDLEDSIQILKDTGVHYEIYKEKEATLARYNAIKKGERI